MITAAVAFFLAVAAPDADPRLSGLDLEGWTVVERGRDGVFTLTRHALGDQIPGFPQVWVRTERPASSGLELEEFDCAARRMREREGYSYAARNLVGDKHQLFSGKAPWKPLPTGLWSRPIFTTACAKQ